jgi:hypothetical protein
MGKRHMTGTIPVIGFPQPGWQFAVAASGDASKWEPPTTAALRKEKRQGISPNALFNRLVHWLEDADADHPDLEPPSTDTSPGPRATERQQSDRELSNELDVQQLSPAKYEISSDTITHTSLSTEIPPLEILELRQNICNLVIKDEKRILDLCASCCDALKRRITSGTISAAEVSLALEPLDQITKRHIVGKQLLRQVRRKIQRSIITNLCYLPTMGTRVDPIGVWLAAAEKLCTVHKRVEDDRLFLSMLQRMPAEAVQQMSSERLFEFIQRAQAEIIRGRSMLRNWSMSAKIFGQALQKLTCAQREAVDAHLQAYLQDARISRQEVRQRLLGWLLTSAFEPDTSNQTVMDIYRILISKGEKINGQQVWLLLAGRLCRPDILSAECQKQLLNRKYVPSISHLKDLFRDVMRSDNPEAGMHQLQFWFREPGIFQTLLDEVNAVPLQEGDVAILQDIAVALGDYRSAYELYHTARMNDESGERIKQWDWRAWIPYVEPMVQDPDIEPNVWSMLRLKEDGELLSEGEIRAKTKLIDEMVELYMGAKHLTDRQLLRRIDLCASSYRALSGGVPLEIIGVLTKIIIKDLEEGQFGRTQRLAWLVQMIAESDGPEAAKRSIEELRQWRTVIHWARRNLRQAVGDEERGRAK